MTNHTLTLSTIAQAFSDALVTAERPDSTKFIKLADDAPDWMQGACMDAHNDMLPNDISYTMISNCACYMADVDCDEWSNGEHHELVDGLVDVYNGRLLTWVGSHGVRGLYVNDAVNELGMAEGDFDIFKALQLGQYHEYEIIFQALLSAFQEQLDELEAEQDDSEGEE